MTMSYESYYAVLLRWQKTDVRYQFQGAGQTRTTRNLYQYNVIDYQLLNFLKLLFFVLFCRSSAGGFSLKCPFIYLFFNNLCVHA